MGYYLPTLVENGWSEPREQLHAIAELWLKGAYGAVQKVILMKWDKDISTRTARGDVEVLVAI